MRTLIQYEYFQIIWKRLFGQLFAVEWDKNCYIAECMHIMEALS